MTGVADLSWDPSTSTSKFEKLSGVLEIYYGLQVKVVKWGLKLPTSYIQCN